MIFLDTSAIYAFADAKDPNHSRAKAQLKRALDSREEILTHTYIPVEPMALIQRRLGLKAAMHLAGDAKAFEVGWVAEGVHDEAVAHLGQTGKRGVSLVGAVSFLIMRKRGVRSAVAFDPDFVAEGFQLCGAD